MKLRDNLGFMAAVGGLASLLIFLIVYFSILVGRTMVACGT